MRKFCYDYLFSITFFIFCSLGIVSVNSFAQVINSVTVSNLVATGEQAKSYEIARVGYNSHHWQEGGIIQVELIQKYFGIGYAKYSVEIGYSQGTTGSSPKVKLIENTGAYNLARVRLGTPENMGNDYAGFPNMILPIKVDVRFYSNYIAKITFIRNRVQTLTEQNQIVVNETPVGENIADFDAATYNTFYGLFSGHTNTTGNNNSFYGTSSGFKNNTGTGNTFLGLNSGYENTTASWNTFVGNESGRFNTTGTINAFFGSGSGYKNTTGTGNTFLGTSSGYENTTASWNTYVGFESGRLNSTGSDNSFFGAGAGYNNLSGASNTFIGTNAGRANNTGTGNTYIGSRSGALNTTASWNTFLGSNSGDANLTGGDNTYIGHAAGILGTTGSANTYLDVRSGENTTTGNWNTFIGNRAGTTNTTGGNNVFLGGYAGRNNTTGALNVFLGHEARPSAGDLTNAIAIGYNAVVSANNSLVLGNNDVKVGIGTSTPSQKLEVNGNTLIKSPGIPSLTVEGTGASAYAGGAIFLKSGDVQSTDKYNQTAIIMERGTTGTGMFSIQRRLVNDYFGQLLDYTDTNGWRFHTATDRTSSNTNERLSIKPNGQVTIGTTTPYQDYKLSVVGNVIADKVKVKKSTNGTWPDFVFSPSYKLPNLTEVESFVKQNSHLPEIPSAAEIEKDGQDLGEMNRLLLKKVEELTLYMIELKKENVQQNIEIEKLKVLKR